MVQIADLDFSIIKQEPCIVLYLPPELHNLHKKWVPFDYVMEHWSSGVKIQIDPAANDSEHKKKEVLGALRALL